MTSEAAAVFEADGSFAGAEIDLRDGYIHLSTAEQVADTLGRHFAGREGLVLVAVDSDALPEPLRWEPARGGALFPHLYAALPWTAVVVVDSLALDVEGRYQLPAGLPA